MGELQENNIRTFGLVRALIKRKQIFLIYREIQMGSGAKSYMRKGFLIYEEIHKYFHHIRGGR
jgi:hypothetical protein